MVVGLKMERLSAFGSVMHHLSAIPLTTLGKGADVVKDPVKVINYCLLNLFTGDCVPQTTETLLNLPCCEGCFTSLVKHS